MKHGGIPAVNERIAQAVRYVGLFVPMILLLYGLLIHNGFVENAHYMSDGAFFAIAIPWGLLALYQFLYPARSSSVFALQLGLYHLFAFFFVLFVSGFSSPLGPAWILLLLISHIYFGSSGLRLSLLVFFAAFIGDTLLFAANEESAVVSIGAFLSAASILVVGAIAIMFNQSHQADGDELAKSKQLEAIQEDRILTIINNLADALISTDSSGLIHIYNAATLNLLDTNADLEGKVLDDVITLYDQDDKEIDIASLLKQARGVVIRDDISATIAGEPVRLELTYSPVRGAYDESNRPRAERDGYVIILRDITKTKSLEEERDEFISVVSHELRTPITIAEGTLSNLQIMMERPDFAQDKLTGHLEKAHEQIVYLARMVNDLSTLSRAERGVADEPERIEIRELVNELFTEYTPQAERKSLTLDLDLSHHLGHVTASQLYLKELIQNFISNAIKYTKEGTVTLQVKRGKDAITFSVKDSGIGISKADQKRIFDKFYRSEDYRTRETGGTGLGLYVAMKLARKLNTKIEVVSRLNHGSTFSFMLPLDKESSKQSRGATPKS